MSQKIEKNDICELLTLTASADEKIRGKTARMLCPCKVQYNNPQIWKRLLEMASDPSDYVRRQVFHTIVDGSPNVLSGDVLSILESMYHDSNVKLRKQVRKRLVQYRKTGKINS